jgi:hypothetical protein
MKLRMTSWLMMTTMWSFHLMIIIPMLLMILHQEAKKKKIKLKPVGLERFSCEENVQTKLLELLRELKAPLKAFSRTLHWAAKSNTSGHVFKVGCQPSCKKVVRNLYTRYNMNGLIPKEKQLYLPYSNWTVSVVLPPSHKKYPVFLRRTCFCSVFQSFACRLLYDFYVEAWWTIF